MFTTTYNNFHFLSEIMPNEENEGYEGYEGYVWGVAEGVGISWSCGILDILHGPRFRSVTVSHLVTGITMCVTTVSQICQDVSCVTTYHDVSGCFKTCPDASRCVTHFTMFTRCVVLCQNVSQCVAMWNESYRSDFRCEDMVSKVRRSQWSGNQLQLWFNRKNDANWVRWSACLRSFAHGTGPEGEELPPNWLCV